jgi:hypothetical protein
VNAVVAPSAADIDGCLQIGLRRRDDGALAYRHELVRRAVEASLPSAHRRDLHVTVLRTLGERGDIAPARLAHHAAGAEDAAAVLVYAQAAASDAAAVARASRGRLAPCGRARSMPRGWCPVNALNCRNAYPTKLTRPVASGRHSRRAAPRS